MRYPPARREPTTEEIGGVTFDDDYAWLEEDTPETLAWQDAQDALAAAHLHDWPGWEALLKAVEAEIGEAAAPVPFIVGTREFRLVREPGAAQKLLRAYDADGNDRTLVDAGSQGASLDWWWPSPTGRYVAFGLSHGGDEQSVLHVVDADTGELLPDRIPHCSHAFVAWLADDSGFYAAVGRVPDAESSQKYLVFHALGDSAPPAEEPVPITLPVHANPWASPDGRYIGLWVLPGLGAERMAFVLDRQSDAGWQEFIPIQERQCFGVFVDDAYVCVIKDDESRGELVSIPIVTSIDKGTWTTLVGATDAVLIRVHQAGDHLVVEELVDTAARVRVLDRSGAPVAVVPLPGVGTVSGLRVDGGSTGSSISFAFSSFVASAAVYRYDLATGELTELTAPARRLEGYEVRRIVGTSADGTLVPAHVVSRPHADGPRPAVIHAYGGFNQPHFPGYLEKWAPFVEAGGVYVHAYLRGGGEFGADWWAGGRHHTKQNTFNDLFAVAEALIAEGLSAPGKIACYGASNGGLLTGAAVTQRPDLWGAVVSVVPILDVMHVLRDSYTAAAALLDYGDPRKPEDAPGLHSWSPYHRIADGTAYPPTIVICGATDMRCLPWHGRKFVARMQAASSSEHPALLRIMDGVGHGTGTTLQSAARVWSEPVAFVMAHLGLEP